MDIKLDKNGLTITKDENNYIVLRDREVKIVLDGQLLHYKEHYGLVYISDDKEEWIPFTSSFDDIMPDINNYINEFIN